MVPFITCLFALGFDVYMLTCVVFFCFLNLIFVFGIVLRIIFVHIYYENLITGENFYSKLSLIDLAGSESATVEDDSGGQATDLLHVMNSLSA